MVVAHDEPFPAALSPSREALSRPQEAKIRAIQRIARNPRTRARSTMPNQAGEKDDPVRPHPQK
jgi:hypothetical protein